MFVIVIKTIVLNLFLFMHIFSVPISMGMKKYSLFSLIPPAKGIHTIEVAEEEKRTALLSFAAGILKKNPEDLLVWKREYFGDLAESGSEDEIYYITNLEKERLLVLKAKEGASPSKELIAMRYLEKIPFKHFHTPKLRGTTVLTFGTEQYEIIAMDLAKGMTLNGYLQKISTTTAGSEQRADLLRELQDAVEKTAIGLAELHNQELKATLNITYEEQKKRIVQRFEKYSNDALSEPVLHYLSSMEDTSPRGLIHGDLNPGNIFYDPETKTVTFIDLDTCFASIEGGPIAYDLAQFSLLFEALSNFYEFDEEEQKILTRSFFNTYGKHGPVVSSESKAFYRYLLEMSYILGFSIDDNPIDVDPLTLQALALAAYFERDLRMKTSSLSKL